MEKSKLSNLKYIYNLRQSDFYIKNGHMPLGIGKHEITGNVYVIFDYDDTKEIYVEWCKQCKEYLKNK